jgi:hypothetical protein
MATEWHTHNQGVRYLLKNGDILDSPDYEMSGGGRRVRLKGETQSIQTYRLGEILRRWATDQAKLRGTELWMSLTDSLSDDSEVRGYHSNPFSLGEIDEGRPMGVRWTLKHATLPIKIGVEVTVAPQRNGTMALNTIILAPAGLFFPASSNYGLIAIGQSNRGWSEDYSAFDIAVSGSPDALISRVYKSPENFNSPFKALAKFFSLLTEIDSNGLSIPTPSGEWIDLEVIHSNVTPEVVAQLQDYLNDAPQVESVIEKFKELQKLLSHFGIVVHSRKTTEFHSALISGAEVTATISLDRDHTLLVNLATGGMRLACSHPETWDYANQADSWDEALARESILGNPDALIEFARASTAKQRIEAATIALEAS